MVSSKGNTNLNPSSFYTYLYQQRLVRERKKIEKKKHDQERFATLNSQEQKRWINNRKFGKRVDDKRKEFESVLWYFETKLLMHRLTMEYYKNRAKWFTFFPILVVTSATSICGFLGSTDLLDASSKQLLAIVSGLLGVLSTFLASNSKYNNYQSKADMHDSAVGTMTNICDNIKLDIFQFEQFAHSARHDMNDEHLGQGDTVRGGTELLTTIATPSEETSSSSDGKNQQEQKNNGMRCLQEEQRHYDGLVQNFVTVGANLEQYRTQYATMKNACHVPYPTRIDQAFRNLKHQFGPATHDVKKYLFPKLYYALWRQIMDQPLFPFYIWGVEIEKFCGRELGTEFQSMLLHSETTPQPMLFYRYNVEEGQGGNVEKGIDEECCDIACAANQ